MRTAFATAAVGLVAISLAACNPGSGDGAASDRAVAEQGGVQPRPADQSTGAGGAVTSSADPNPTGAGATTDAEPGAPGNRMGSTEPVSPTPGAPPR